MADWTRAILIDRALEHIGVLAIGGTVASNDSTRAGEVIDSAHERLRKLGYAPFATSAIPPWAQMHFRDVVAGDLAMTYGISGQRLVEFKLAAQRAEFDLQRQVSGHKPPIRVAIEEF